MADREFLVADIGGTNARFAIARPNGALEHVKVLQVADHPQFDEALAAYVAELDSLPEALCVASAGAMQGDTIYLTNAPWSLGERALGTRFGFHAVRLINDWQAQARFVGTMPASQAQIIKPGTPVEGAPVLAIGPGTGLGQSLFVPGQPPRTVATEGGHRLLPVRSDRELRLFQRLEAKLGHQPILEDALSGRGILNLYHSVVLDAGEEPSLTEPPQVTSAALEGPGYARDAVLWFLDLLACACADACVVMGARGGVAISGGITPRLIDLLDEQSFAETFARKGILKDYLSEVPVSLVTEPYAALHGAASVLRDTLQG